MTGTITRMNVLENQIVTEKRSDGKALNVAIKERKSEEEE